MAGRRGDDDDGDCQRIWSIASMTCCGPGTLAAFPICTPPPDTSRLGGVRVKPSELPAIMHGYFSAFPDADSEVTDWIESPTGVAVEQMITATHTGPWMTAFGELAPTGRAV